MTGSFSELLDRYRVGRHFDEVFYPNGDVREHYAHVFERLDTLDAAEFKRREKLKDSLFRTQGITFTVYGEAENAVERTFPLDLLPRIIPGPEWAAIEAGLQQRVAALNAFLQDIYCGQQEIARDGVIPIDLVHSSTGYQPAARGINVPLDARCLVSGIDLVRDIDGKYLVLEDNLRNPSGVSYVLENRSAMTRVLPRAFDQSNVQPIDHYPKMLLDALRAVSPTESSKPRIVLLTPGRFNSAYYEHSCLARLMGIELVEASDLVVEDATVSMRTTKGLKQVDVIYRRTDDAFLDPHVFKSDSMLGVAGLVKAARENNVTIANAIGNGLADDKAIYAFVPAMIDYYLGQRPKLSNVETYLPVNPDQINAILRRIDELVIKPVDGSGGHGLLFGPNASDEELENCKQAILQEPRMFVAQEIVGFSQHPTLVEQALEGRHVDLRPFVVSSDKIEVLPGGLTRVATRKGSLVVNSSQGGGSKDTWVTSTSGDTDQDRSPTTKNARHLHFKGPRQDLVLASTGSELFWIGRYLERAKNTALFLDVTYHSILEGDPSLTPTVLRELLTSLLLDAEFAETGRPYEASAVVHFLVADSDNPGSIRSAISTARQNMRQVQEKVSVEGWETLNDLFLDVTAFDFTLRLDDHPFDLFDNVWRKCSMVFGIVDETMSHNDGWRFLNLGRQIERALLTSRMLAVFLPKMQSAGHDLAFHRWITALRSAGAMQEYQKLFQSSLDPIHTALFLIQNDEFPRSLRYCLDRCQEALSDLLQARSDHAPTRQEPAHHGIGQVESPQRRLGRLLSDVRYTDLNDYQPIELQALILDVAAGLEHFADDTHDRFFGTGES